MTSPRNSRINARLDSKLAQKLATLRQRTSQSTTLVVCEAIERYHAAVTKAAASPAELFERAGFIGCVDGPGDLSVRYKDEFRLSLAKKT
jgi:hypothetical protein